MTDKVTSIQDYQTGKEETIEITIFQRMDMKGACFDDNGCIDYERSKYTIVKFSEESWQRVDNVYDEPAMHIAFGRRFYFWWSAEYPNYFVIFGEVEEGVIKQKICKMGDDKPLECEVITVVGVSNAGSQLPHLGELKLNLWHDVLTYKCKHGHEEPENCIYCNIKRDNLKEEDTMTEEQLRNRWLGLCERLGATDPGAIALTFKWIVFLYSSRRRCYHTLAHIADCLQKLDVVRGLLYKPDIVEMALWLHDIIYVTRRSDNEEQSAEFADEMLSKMGIPREVIDQVKLYILATGRHASQDIRDLNFLLDIDMSILGAEPPVFDEYERGIRKEWWWVHPVSKFNEGRAAFLRDLIDPEKRKSIFITEWFQAHYERQAYENIKRSLTRLSK